MKIPVLEYFLETPDSRSKVFHIHGYIFRDHTGAGPAQSPQCWIQTLADLPDRIPVFFLCNQLHLMDHGICTDKLFHFCHKPGNLIRCIFLEFNQQPGHIIGNLIWIVRGMIKMFCSSQGLII